VDSHGAKVGKMRLLSKNSRENKSGKPTVLGEDTRIETVQHQIESTQAIGVRYETIHGGLDSIGRVVEHLQGHRAAARRDPPAGRRGVRSPPRRARRADRPARQLRPGPAPGRPDPGRGARSQRPLAAAETALGESDARRQTQEAALEDNALEIDRLRNALLQSDLKVGSLDASLRDSTARIEHLTQDVETLRTQAQDIDARRGEAEAALARANQDNALLGEETATLKKRVDQAGLDVARLSRIETDLEAQLATERARVQATENALAGPPEPTAAAPFAAWRARSKPAAPRSRPCRPVWRPPPAAPTSWKK
jgi:crescentin